jgi:hypothetical protein
MRHTLSSLVFTVAAWAVSVLPGIAGELIVARAKSGVELFFRVPMTDVESLFGKNVPGLITPDGYLNTSLFEDNFLPDTDNQTALLDVRVGDARIFLRPITMMVHAAARPVPFETVFDAKGALTVCTVPTTSRPLNVNEFTWLGGWFAVNIQEKEALRIRFPETGRAARELKVHFFVNNKLESSETVIVEDGGEIELSVSGGLWQRIFGG